MFNKIPKQLNWWEHLFEERIEPVSDETVRCGLHGKVCVSQCKECTWLTHYQNNDGHEAVVCRPPVV
ncbi:hypothetical protein [Desertibacillus haloalkaliphilus]|uniref:hypothetical protein n=1 Tax=Desertibacillus haloalkaliphilus TaxID=1328930 RepID=UPI001C26E227|nr:hypothetical protein [Desertibacillus haloalkaliphilus]MBU8908229.1 hypothetical protein [Desertibacillus haloalkaliphilus]